MVDRNRVVVDQMNVLVETGRRLTAMLARRAKDAGKQTRNTPLGLPLGGNADARGALADLVRGRIGDMTIGDVEHTLTAPASVHKEGAMAQLDTEVDNETTSSTDAESSETAQPRPPVLDRKGRIAARKVG